MQASALARGHVPAATHASCIVVCIVVCILKPSTSYQRQVQPVRSSNMCCLVMHLYYCVVYATWHMFFLHHNKAVLLILHTDVLSFRHLCCLVADEAARVPLSLSETAFGWSVQPSSISCHSLDSRQGTVWVTCMDWTLCCVGKGGL